MVDPQEYGYLLPEKYNWDQRKYEQLGRGLA